MSVTPRRGGVSAKDLMARLHGLRSALASAVATVVAYLLVVWDPTPIIALLGAGPLALWLPGAALLRLSRPEHSPVIDADLPSDPAMASLLKMSHRVQSQKTGTDVAVSTAVSAALTIVVGLGLALLTDRVPRVPLATVLALISVLASVFTVKKLSIRKSATHPETLRTRPRMTAWTVATALGCLGLVVILGYLSWKVYQSPAPGNSYTSIAVVARGHEEVITVSNHDQQLRRYRLIIARNRRTIARRTFSLAEGVSYTMQVPRSHGHRRGVARLVLEPQGWLYRKVSF